MKSKLHEVRIKLFDVGLMIELLNSTFWRCRLSGMIMLFLGLTFINPVYGQSNQDDSIRLPDIVILGEADKLPDTISLDERLRGYWRLESLRSFEFQPKITPDAVEHYAEETSGYERVLGLYAGNNDFVALRGVYNSEQEAWLSFNGNLANYSPDSNRTRKTVSFYWTPDYEKFSISAGVNYFSYIDEHNTIWYNHDLKGNDVNHYGAEFEIKNYQSDSNNNDIGSYKLKAAFNNYEQDTTVAKSIIDIDFQLLASLGFPSPLFSSEIDLAYVRENPSAKIGLVHRKFGDFNHPGLFLLADKNSVLPAPQFSFIYDLSSYFYLHLSNLPNIETHARHVYLLENPDQNIELTDRVTKTPLNAHISLNNDRLIPLTIAYDLKWHKDFLYYQYNYNNGLFSFEHTDILKQIASLKTAVHYKNFTLGNVLSFTEYEKFIAFQPRWENRATIRWENESFAVWSDLAYIEGRRREDKYSMSNPILWDAHLRLRLTKNLTVNSSLFNILDRSYQKYDVMSEIAAPESIIKEFPAESLSYFAGLSWTF